MFRKTATARLRILMAELDRLIELARHVKMSSTESEAQRKSFAFGNAAFENPLITKQMVEQEAEKLKQNK
jgi:hypothetical protein